MWGTRKLVDTLTIQKYLRFYEIMGYPIPKNAELYFQYSSTKTLTSSKSTLSVDDCNYSLTSSFSWNKKSKYMDEYLQEINRLKSIFQSIPFVHQIFLCNSISFNSLGDNSDIDLFIVANPWRIWTVKFRSMILFALKGSKRIWSRIRKKICLSFFITSNNQNLYSISLPSIDVYLAYWISHLVLIYQKEEKNNPEFFEQNWWVRWILPNYQWKQTISLWIDYFTWNTKFKNFMELLLNNIIGDVFEWCVKYAQKSVICFKRLVRPSLNKDVVISDSMLKFHQDVREKISLKYNVKVK